MKAQLVLTEPECMAILLALNTMMEDIKTTGNDQRIPWTPEARQTQRDIMAASKSASKKISDASGLPAEIPEYEPGDENEFLTKES